MSSPTYTRIPQKRTPFDPQVWGWFFDNAVPQAVKKSYSPQPRWAAEPFGEKDLRFFLKGLHELHERFTDDRPLNRNAPVQPYFRHPRFRSSYLLYFFPVHASKFFILFDRHTGAMEALKTEWKRRKKIRIADLGSGPGTASIALLLYLLEREPELFDIGPIELTWYDREKAVFEDGRRLIKMLEEQFESIRGKVQLKCRGIPVSRALDELRKQEWEMVLSGNFLNELVNRDRNFPLRMVKQLYPKVGGAGFLFVEPATKPASQQISTLRDQVLAARILPPERGLWGPCLHQEPCPLRQNRDWCHQSVPREFPYKWFTRISKSLETSSTQTKFSYLWLSSHDHPSPKALSKDRRVISDALKNPNGRFEVQLCEPHQINRLKIAQNQEIHRGDLLRFKSLPEKRGESNRRRPEGLG